MTVEELLKASVALFEEARKTEDSLQSMACSSAAQAGAMIAQAMMQWEQYQEYYRQKLEDDRTDRRDYDMAQ